jgi:hypothetical protein
VDHGFGTIKSPSRPFCQTARQVHGTRILFLSDPGLEQEMGEADGLLSQCAKIEVGVRTADCLPVLMSTEDGHCVGAFHAGWRGAVSGIVRQGLGLMQKASGADASRMRVVLGPAIGPCCFEVGPEVWESVIEGTPGYVRKGQKNLDLWDLVTHQLALSGVPQDSIGRISLCTRCHSGLFFSHRGMGPERNGRSMLNFIRPV